MTHSAGLSAVYSLSCTGADAATLQLDFRRVDDRFAQSVRLLSSSGATLAHWVGVQQSEPQAWPASPPIQELSLESIDGRDVLLGVGQAGKCHWSVSVETAEIDGLAALRFDLACRCPGPPDWLGSTYQIESIDEGPQLEPQTLSLTAGEATRLVRDGSERLQIEPTLLPQDWPGTVRWRYAILARS